MQISRDLKLFRTGARSGQASTVGEKRADLARREGPIGGGVEGVKVLEVVGSQAPSRRRRSLKDSRVGCGRAARPKLPSPLPRSEPGDHGTSRQLKVSPFSVWATPFRPRQPSCMRQPWTDRHQVCDARSVVKWRGVHSFQRPGSTGVLATCTVERAPWAVPVLASPGA